MTRPKTNGSNRLVCALVAACFICLHVEGDVQADEWKHVTKVDGLPIQMVQFMERLDGQVWVGTLDGLARFKNGTGEKVLTGQAVWDVLPAGKERYWLGTQEGVLLLEGGKVTPCLEGFSVGSLESFGQKAIWAVTEEANKISLMELRDGKWGLVPRFKGQTVSELFKARDGVVWVLLEPNGIVAADPAKEPSEWAHHLKGHNVRSFCQDAQGQIWCGTWGKGVKCLQDGKWERHLKKEKAAFTSIVQGGNGDIWAATNAHGLWQYDGKEWKNHLRKEGTINLLTRTADGRVYISSQSVPALRVWNGKQWETLVDIPGGFRTVVLGPEKKLWAGHTLSGLYIQP